MRPSLILPYMFVVVSYCMACLHVSRAWHLPHAPRMHFVVHRQLPHAYLPLIDLVLIDACLYGVTCNLCCLCARSSLLRIFFYLTPPRRHLYIHHPPPAATPLPLPRRCPRCGCCNPWFAPLPTCRCPPPTAAPHCFVGHSISVYWFGGWWVRVLVVVDAPPTPRPRYLG